MKSGGLGAALLAMAEGCSRPDQRASNDLAELDAVETATRIRNGELSAVEAVDAAIARARRINPKINAIATKTFKAAHKLAGTTTGPLAGVPTFIKDLDDVTGVASGFGSRAFPGYKGKTQTPLIDAILNTGVVSLGKSTTPEFGLTATTEPVSTGVTRNPWNTDYSTGGSSGGAAALVASGVVPIAHASDGGGSIRIPANCCGNVGLKVSRGRNPPARPELEISIAVHGVQSRTVRDTAAMIAAIEQPAEISGLPPVGLVTGPSERRLRIGLFTHGTAGRPVDPVVVEFAKAHAKICEGLGHSVEEVELPIAPTVEDDFILYWAANANDAISTWEQATGLKRNRLAFEPLTLGLADFYRTNADKYDGAVARLKQTPAQLDTLFDQYDVLLSPVLAQPTVEIGYLDTTLDYDVAMPRLLDYAQFTGLYNITGSPAISLPLSMLDNGLPIGAMFGARTGDEATLLALGYELEEAAPWRARRPPLFG
ncbi:MAG: amidase [Parvularculaceae bacterium]|nr:amidase [Parvularculaceae bacterium]